MLYENNGSIIPYGRLQQTFGIIWCCRHDDLEPRHMIVPGFQALWVLCRQTVTAAPLSPQHKRYFPRAAAHEPVFGRLVRYLVYDKWREIHEQYLDDRSHPGYRCTNTGTGEACFGNRRINHPLGSKLIKKTDSNLIRTAALTYPAAKQKNGLVTV